MKKIIIFFLITLRITTFASEFKVMSFNTMCDLCGRENFDDFSMRKEGIKKIIENANADLYSLQEIRSSEQLNYFFQQKKNFKFIFWDSFILSYPDPALAINTNRFAIVDQGHFWLGPNQGNFSVGWKYALPRQVQWVKLKDKLNNKEFIFAGSHFDNRIENMLGSAQMVNDFISSQKVPVIFAGDTNSTIDFEGYKTLTKNNLLNSFDQKAATRNMASVEGKDLCYLRKGKKFPDCRVDHILYTKKSFWKVQQWQIFNFKTAGAKNFPSDHRPVMATFTYQDAQ